MKKVLFLENLPYKSHITVGSHHYARLFSESYDVLWISLPWHLFQLIKDRNSDRYKNWNYNEVQLISDHLKAFTPFILLPYRNMPFLSKEWYVNNLYSFIPGLLRTIKKEGFLSPDIAWFTDPRHISVLKHIKPKKQVYRCVDNLECFNDVPKSLLKVERRLVEKSEHVFYTSLYLKNKFEHLNSNAYYLPNGCDYDFFSTPKINPEYVKEMSLFDKSYLNILYTGAIAEWMDFEAIRLILKIENVRIYLIGPVRTSIPDDIKSNINVNILGPKPYDMMPYYMSNADIGIIPFKINKITDFVNPIKLYEYCACRLPTVSSNFKTVADIEGPFYKYRCYDELEEIIRNLKDNREYMYALSKIDDFAKENSWRERYSFVNSLLNLVGG